MPTWFATWVILLIVGIAILLPLYARLLRALRELNNDEYVAIGSPTLFMLSPGRGLRLQRFIYGDSRKAGIEPEVAWLSGILGVLTPLFVALVLGVLVCGILPWQ